MADKHGGSKDTDLKHALLSMAEWQVAAGQLDVARNNIARAEDEAEGPDPIALIPAYMSCVLGDITIQQLIARFKAIDSELDMSLNNWEFGILDEVIAKQGEKKKKRVDVIRQYCSGEIDLAQMEAQLNALEELS